MMFVFSSEWKELSRLSEDPHLLKLRYLAVNGGLKTSNFRSVCWSLLLGVLNGRSQSWVTQRRCDRSRQVIRPYIDINYVFLCVSLLPSSGIT